MEATRLWAREKQNQNCASEAKSGKTIIIITVTVVVVTDNITICWGEKYAGDFPKHFKLNVEETHREISWKAEAKSRMNEAECLGSRGVQKRDGWRDSKEAGPRGPNVSDATVQRSDRRLG